MGQNSSWDAHQQFLGEYQLEARNPELNLTYLTHRDTRQHCLLRQLSFADPKDFRAAQKQLQRRLHQFHPNATRLIRVESQEQESMCSKMYRLCALWEHSPVTLADEVNRRALERTPFEGKQVLQILRALVGGLLHYCALGTAYEALTTRSVLVGWGGFKLADPLMLGAQRNLEVVHGHRNIKNVYLSPQEWRAVELEQSQGWHPSDAIFTAGIIALEAGLLQRQDGCYLEQSSKLNWLAVGGNLQKVRQRYGERLKGVIAGMLEGEVSKRTDLRELWEILQGFSEGKLEKVHEEKMVRPQFANKPLQMGGISASQVTNPTKPFTFYSNQKLRLSLVDSLHSPQRLFETTHLHVKRSQQEIKPFPQQRPLPLLQMKTINTITQLPQTAPPLFSFKHQLNTSPSPSPFVTTARDGFKPPNSDSDCDSTDIVLRKYEHHSSPSPPSPQSGYFVEEFKLGSRYEGFKQCGKRQGWGKFYFQDGGLYQGEWHENKMHGYGRLYYQSGKLAYEGQWASDQFSGMGKLYNETYTTLKEPYDYSNLAAAESFWVYYEGQFVSDVKQGEGVLKLSNGEYFKGRFQRDEINGEGEYYCLGGKKARGRWREGILQSLSQSRGNR